MKGTATIQVSLSDEERRLLAAEVAALIGAGSVSTARKWMDTAAAAEYLAWPKERVYKLSAAGRIPHRKHDGRLLFRADELDAWLDQFVEGPVVL